MLLRLETEEAAIQAVGYRLLFLSVCSQARFLAKQSQQGEPSMRTPSKIPLAGALLLALLLSLSPGAYAAIGDHTTLKSNNLDVPVTPVDTEVMVTLTSSEPLLLWSVLMIGRNMDAGESVTLKAVIMDQVYEIYGPSPVPLLPKTNFGTTTVVRGDPTGPDVHSEIIGTIELMNPPRDSTAGTEMFAALAEESAYWAAQASSYAYSQVFAAADADAQAQAAAVAAADAHAQAKAAAQASAESAAAAQAIAAAYAEAAAAAQAAAHSAAAAQAEAQAVAIAVAQVQAAAAAVAASAAGAYAGASSAAVATGEASGYGGVSASVSQSKSSMTVSASAVAGAQASSAAMTETGTAAGAVAAAYAQADVALLALAAALSGAGATAEAQAVADAQAEAAAAAASQAAALAAASAAASAGAIATAIANAQAAVVAAAVAIASAEATAAVAAFAQAQATAAIARSGIFHRPVDAEYAVTLLFGVSATDGFDFNVKNVFETADGATVSVTLGPAPPGPPPSTIHRGGGMSVR